MSSNEVRQAIGMKPVDDPKADQLVNSNITQPQPYPPAEGQEPPYYYDGGYEYDDYDDSSGGDYR